MIISELVSSLDFVCGTFFHREQYRVEKASIEWDIVRF